MWCGRFKLQLEIRHSTALTAGAKHWHRQKAVFYVFCFGAPSIYPLNPFQRNATTSNCPLNTKSHPAGMRICYAIFAGISLRLCSISLRSFRITFAAYLPTHIKSLWDFFQSLLNNHRDNLYIISKFFPPNIKRRTILSA